MVWVNAAAGVFLSAIYVTAALRLWQRRSPWWGTVAAATAVVYAYPTATYIWHVLDGTAEASDQPWGLLLFLLPAILILRMVAWGVRDEARTRNVIEHLANGSST